MKEERKDERAMVLLEKWGIRRSRKGVLGFLGLRRRKEAKMKGGEGEGHVRSVLLFKWRRAKHAGNKLARLGQT